APDQVRDQALNTRPRISAGSGHPRIPWPLGDRLATHADPANFLTQDTIACRPPTPTVSRSSPPSRPQLRWAWGKRRGGEPASSSQVACLRTRVGIKTGGPRLRPSPAAIPEG